MKNALTTLMRGWLLGIVRTLRRFPLPAAFILLLTLKTILYQLGMKSGSGYEEGVVLYYLATAALLATVTATWGETRRSKRLPYSVTLATQLLWLGYAAYLYTQTRTTLATTTANAATVALLVVLLPGLPYLRSRSELAFRRFCSRLVFSALAAGLTGLILFGGVGLLLASLDPLFGITLGGHAAEVCLTVFLVCCAPLVFLARMPAPDALGQEHHAVGALTRYAVRYVLNPLLCAYAVVLYAYAAYILLTWNLPDGWVSALVSALMGGVVLAVYLFLPLRRTDGWERDDFVARYGPALMLPLLVLMSVGIGRRLYDYGLTVRRLYLLLFNLWCYGACFYLIFTRSRRIKWLLLSPVVLVFLASVGPWGIVQTTQRVLTREVKRALEASGVAACPMDREAYGHTLDAMTEETARYVNDKLAYLLDTYGPESVAAFIKGDVDPAVVDPRYETAFVTFRGNFVSTSTVVLPDSMARLRDFYYTQAFTPDELRRDTVCFNLTGKVPGETGKSLLFDVALDELRGWDTLPTTTPSRVLTSRNGRACLVVENFDLSYYTTPRTDKREVNTLTLAGTLLAK